MPYKTYTIAMLADTVMRPVQSFDPVSAPTAIRQALLLFKLGTCLASPPEDEVSAELVDMAVLYMADRILFAKDYAAVSAAPFTSESIGSYSYGKAAKAVSNGDKTGVDWFDMAVDTLGVCDRDNGGFAGGGIEVFEHDAMFTQGTGNNVRMLSPQDLNLSRAFGYDPAPGQRTPVAPAPIGGSPADDGGPDLIESTEFPGYYEES
jgi:hypothetical protein